MSKIRDFLDCENIQICFNKTLNDRYSVCLTRFNSETQNVAVIILKNPASSFKNAIGYNNISYADVQDIDKTTNHVLDYLNDLEEDYKEIYILNLFPYFDNIPTALNCVYSGMAKNHLNASMEKNISEIDRVLSLDNIDLYCAWGGNSGIHKKIYDNTIQRIINIIQLKKIPATQIYEVNNNNRIQYLPNTPTYPTHGLKW